MKIPIKKHTQVRRPVSRHITLLMDNTYNVPFDLQPMKTLLLVKDLSKGLENPLITSYTLTFPRMLKDTKWAEPKPSLWQRLKRKGRR